jgi:hypothetical protein
MARTPVISHLADAAYNNPEEAAGVTGDLGAIAGGFAEGADSVLGGLGNAASTVGAVASTRSNIRDGRYAAAAGDAAAGMASVASLAPSLMSSAPLIGTVGSAAQTAGHAVEAYRQSDKINDAYYDNPFWQEAGATALGAVNTAASMDMTGISSGALALGQGAVNGLGMATGAVLGGDYAFNASSLAGHAGHMAYDTARGVGWAANKTAQGASYLYNSLPSASSLRGYLPF